MAETVIQKLERFQGVIAKAKSDRDNLKGRQARDLERLKEEFGCTSIAQAQSLLAKKQAQLDALETELEQGIAQLEQQYEW